MSSNPDQQFELENQFIMRMPEAPAAALREALKNGSTNLKERLRLKLENDIRHGTLYFDHYVLPTKVVDLPGVIESFKSIDRKSLYKTADVCQMLICMDKEEPPVPEDEQKPQKKKDGLKVEKKYLHPHGITPPLKNVRKRRFRKTLKKKQYLDQPEIEKEVRRLLRMDYEAHHVSWEVIDEEEDKTKEGGGKDILMQGSKTNEEPTTGGNSHRIAVELFGDALSDSDGDEEDIGGGDIDDDMSRMSIDMEGEVEDESSRMSDSAASYSQSQEASKSKDKKSSYVTSFSKDMFMTPGTSSSTSVPPRSRSPEKAHKGSSSQARQRHTSSSNEFTSLTRGDLQTQLNDLKQQLTEISARRQIQETELSTTDNAALKNRLETVLNKLVNDQIDKEREIRDVEAMLNQY